MPFSRQHEVGEVLLGEQPSIFGNSTRDWAYLRIIGGVPINEGKMFPNWKVESNFLDYGRCHVIMAVHFFY